MREPVLALSNLATSHAHAGELRHAEQVRVSALLLRCLIGLAPIAVLAKATRILVAQLVLLLNAHSFDGAETLITKVA